MVDKFLHNLPRMNNEETEQLDHQAMSTEIESVVKSLVQTQRRTGPDRFHQLILPNI